MPDLEKYRASSLEKERTADLLRVVPKGRDSVLDIGARDGHFSRQLTRYFRSVMALDLEKPRFEDPGVVCVAGDVTRLQFPDQSFDCVFCTEVLEHIPALEKAAREITRVARHEIIIGVPYRQDTRVGRATCGACWKVTPAWGHVNAFDDDRLLGLFPGLRLLSKTLVASNSEATNPVSTFLMDVAGNPWGTYDEDIHCVHCGQKLLHPPRKRSLATKICSAAAERINRAQAPWTKPHANWIHVVLSKD